VNRALAVVLGALTACSSPAQPSLSSTTVPPPSSGSGSDAGSGSGVAREIVLTAHRKFRIAVLGFEVIASQAQSKTVAVAHDLTAALQREAREDHDIISVAPLRELLDEKLVANCDSEAPACMASIGANLAVDQLLFGRVEERGARYLVDAKLLDIETKIVVTWTVVMEAADVQATAHKAYVTLVGQVR
jgi:TolB-like protein